MPKGPQPTGDLPALVARARPRRWNRDRRNPRKPRRGNGAQSGRQGHQSTSERDHLLPEPDG